MKPTTIIKPVQFWFATLLLLNFATESALAQPSYVRTDGLSGWYPFNGNTMDESGNNQNLINLGAQLATDRFNESDKAFSFSGSGPYMKKPNFNTTASQQTRFAVSAWFRSFQDGVILSYGEETSPPNRAFGLLKQDIDGEPSALPFLYSSNGDLYASSYLPFAPNGISEGAWHHIVFWRTESTETNWYILFDGGLLEVDFDNADWWGNDKTLFLGSSPDLGTGILYGESNFYFDGKIDDVGIWMGLNSNFTICDAYKLYFTYEYTNPSNVWAPEGSDVSFSVPAPIAGSLLQFQWEVNTGIGGWQPVSEAGQYSGATTNVLSISNISNANDNYLFRCIIDYIGDGFTCIDVTEPATLSLSALDVSEAAKTIDVSIYPNPTNGQLIIESLLKQSGDVQTNVINLVGQTVYTSTENHTAGLYRNTIELDLPAGIYYLVLQTDNGRASKKIEILK